MKHLKKFNESLETENFTKSSNDDYEKESLKNSFLEFSKNLGIDSQWLAEYLQECFEFNLDKNEMPFSDDEFEDIMSKIESLLK